MTEDARARLRAIRRAIPSDEQLRRADALVATATSLPWWRDVRRLGVYRAIGGELDLGALERWAWDHGVETYVPVVDGQRLRFARSTPTTAWSPNRFGIDEPNDVEPVGATTLDVVIAPAVAVDRHGNRVGMGAGFYDRTFADRPRPVLVAAVHPEQVADALDPEPWDVRMDAIVTPDEMIVVAPSAG